MTNGPYAEVVDRTVLLIRAFRAAASRLRDGATYKWSHYAMCNCGNLAQVVTELDPSTIYEAAFDRPGDWGEQAREYCPTSGRPMDLILRQMLDLGLLPEDIRHIERLSHPHVLRRIDRRRKPLHHARREDCVLFFETWATMLEERLSDTQLAELAELDRAPLAVAS